MGRKGIVAAREHEHAVGAGIGQGFLDDLDGEPGQRHAVRVAVLGP
jgi:hypothetical protein